MHPLNTGNFEYHCGLIRQLETAEGCIRRLEEEIELLRSANARQSRRMREDRDDAVAVRQIRRGIKRLLEDKEDVPTFKPGDTLHPVNCCK